MKAAFGILVAVVAAAGIGWWVRSGSHCEPASAPGAAPQEVKQPSPVERPPAKLPEKQPDAGDHTAAPVKPPEPVPSPADEYRAALAARSECETVRTLQSVDQDLEKAATLLAADKLEDARALYKSARRSLQRLGMAEKSQLEALAKAIENAKNEQTRSSLAASREELLELRHQMQLAFLSEDAVDAVAKAAGVASEAADEITDAIRDGASADARKSRAAEFLQAYGLMRAEVKKALAR